MSSILNSAITRRQLLLALAAWPLAGLANSGSSSLISGLRQWGSGEFRRFGFLVYEATLWAGKEDPLRPPLALRLTYKRKIAGVDIAAASVKEIRQLGIVDEARLNEWGALMAKIFPNVSPGDQILGVHLPEGARFLFNDQPLASVDDPAFAKAFFAIWLDPKTSAPDLRSALLKRPAA